MESNSGAPVFNMNGKEKKWSVRRSELSIGSLNSEECQMTGLLLVVCSMMLAWQLQTQNHLSWSSNMEPGDRRVLPSGVENEQLFSI